MKKIQVVIASTLKPVDDPRTYKRFGLSMAKTNKYAINIIGFDTKNKSSHPDIIFHPSGLFSRMSIKRVLLKWKILRKVINLKPKILIIQTHELIIPAIIFKIGYPGKVIYDVRENYYRNLIYQDVFPPVMKHLLALWVRLKEKVCSYFFDGFILAENGYQNEFKFHSSKPFQVIENKVKLETKITRKYNENLDFIFSGNLSKNSGVLKAIELYSELKKHIPKSTLKIVGHSPSNTFLETLNSAIKDRDDIKLIGGANIIPHNEIQNEIASSNIGLVTYQVNPSNENCIPTKVYEYLALGLPFISEQETTWTKLAQQTNLVLPIDFKNFNPQKVAEQLKTLLISKNPVDNSQFTWESEEEKFLSFLKQIIS